MRRCLLETELHTSPQDQQVRPVALSTFEFFEEAPDGRRVAKPWKQVLHTLGLIPNA